jgi:uncharacterized membrane protein HdeD (DUF308 family)
VSFPLSGSVAGPLHEEHLSLRPVWWLLLALGLVSVVVGFLAISSVFIATMASVFVFGWLLLIEGFAQLFQGIMVRNWRGFALHLLAAALYLIVGLFLLEDPIQAAAVITLLLAANFFVSGLLRIILPLVMKFPSWPWVLLNGVVNLILGIMIFRGWPESSLWVIGLFVGIDLLLHGWSSIILALTVRQYQPVATA